jgi:putative FmdB family regulatory protein
MPVYEYLCKDCGQQFDKMRPMSQADVAIECTNCHSEATRRLISRFFASSEGRAIATQSSSCSGCGGGSCGSCGCGSN